MVLMLDGDKSKRFIKVNPKSMSIFLSVLVIILTVVTFWSFLELKSTIKRLDYSITTANKCKTDLKNLESNFNELERQVTSHEESISELWQKIYEIELQ